MSKSRILIFVPAFNCQSQLPRVLEVLNQDWVRESITEVIVVENRSTDNTLQVAELEASKSKGFIKVLQNDQNYGLGGSHKVAIKYAAENWFDWILIVHGDDQGNLEDFRELVMSDSFNGFDAVLGSRFHKRSRRTGYGLFRTTGNYAFNLLFSLLFFRKISDLGSGLNMYKVSAVEKLNTKSPDGLAFPAYLLIHLVLNGNKIDFIPITWKETDQVSNAKVISQSLLILKMVLRAATLRKRFLRVKFSTNSDQYSFTVRHVGR